MASKLYPETVLLDSADASGAGLAGASAAAYGTIVKPQPEGHAVFVLPYQQQALLYPTTPQLGQQQNEPQQAPVYAPVVRSVNACLAPLYFRTYWLILYFLLVSFPWGLFLFSFVSGTLAGAFGAIAVCGVGLPLLALFAYSWRALAHADVWLTKTFCPPSDLTETVVMRRVGVEHSGFLSWLKASVLHPLTWSSVLYSLLWRPLWSTFTFVTVLTWLCVALALIAKPFLGAAGLDPFEHCDGCQWFLQSRGAYVILVVLGAVLLYGLCVAVHGLASVERRVSWWALGRGTISALDYASYTVVPRQRSASAADGMVEIGKLIDPADNNHSATLVRYALPATPVLPYARRRRSTCALSACFCCCCCTVLAGLLCAATAGLLAARCATSARSEMESEYRLNTTNPGIAALLVDATGIAWNSEIALEGAGNATDQIVIKATLSYVRGEDGSAPDILSWLTSYTEDGSLYLSASGVGLWPVVRHCPTLRLRTFLPASAAGFVGRPQLTFAASNARITVASLPVAVLDAVSKLRLTTSNAEVRFAADIGPTLAGVEVQTSNAAVSGANVTAARLDCATSNARIRFSAVQTPGLFLETSNARITLDSATLPANSSSTVRLYTTNAAIEVESLHMPLGGTAVVGLSTSNADVEAAIHALEGDFSLFAPNGDAELENLSGRQVQYTINTGSEKKGHIGTEHGPHSVSLRTSNADAELTLFP